MLRVMELYSGIGGFHYALEESQIPHKVVAAADINNVANDIYRHNFPETKILQRSIESITVKELDKLSPDLIHMSPPCQPFVRVGKQQDAGDKRTKSFLHLIEVIPQMQKQPQYIFMENVKGFDTSETREAVLTMLHSSGYHCQEFLVSPLQFGIPNSRLRYYLLAKLKPMQFGFDTRNQIWEELPTSAAPYLVHLTDPVKHRCHSDDKPANTNNDTGSCETSSTPNETVDYSTTTVGDSVSQTCGSKQFDSSETDADEIPSGSQILCESTSTSENIEAVPFYEKHKITCKKLEKFFEKKPVSELSTFMVPPKFLQRFWVMDIVKASNQNSCCFTKRYGHHIEGAGSVIRTAEHSTVDLSQYKRDRVYTPEVERGVASLGLRFFTPREIANLMCFPQTLEFPPDVSTIQCYRVLGNSLNIHVVAVLLRLLILGDR